MILEVTMTQLARPDDHAVAFYNDAEIVSEIAAYAAEVSRCRKD